MSYFQHSCPLFVYLSLKHTINIYAFVARSNCLSVYFYRRENTDNLTETFHSQILLMIGRGLITFTSMKFDWSIVSASYFLCQQKALWFVTMKTFWLTIIINLPILFSTIKFKRIFIKRFNRHNFYFRSGKHCKFCFNP